MISWPGSISCLVPYTYTTRGASCASFLRHLVEILEIRWERRFDITPFRPGCGVGGEILKMPWGPKRSDIILTLYRRGISPRTGSTDTAGSFCRLSWWRPIIVAGVVHFFVVRFVVEGPSSGLLRIAALIVFSSKSFRIHRQSDDSLKKVKDIKIFLGTKKHCHWLRSKHYATQKKESGFHIVIQISQKSHSQYLSLADQ